MEQIVGDIPGIACYFDDIVVTGKCEQEHLVSLQKTMEHLNTAGLRLKLDRCNFFQNNITYLSHILDKEGIRPHPDKIKAITAMPEPKNQSELRSFLGMANYYDRFVPGLATNCAPLNDLLQKNKQWSEHVEAVKSVKRLLTSADTLSHYDPSLPISLSCDASPVGIGAVIFHTFPDGTEANCLCLSQVDCSRTQLCTNPKRSFRNCVWCTKVSSVPTRMEISIDHSH